MSRVFSIFSNTLWEASEDNNNAYMLLWESLGHFPNFDQPLKKRFLMPGARSFVRYVFSHKLIKCVPMDFSNILYVIYHSFLSSGLHSLLPSDSPLPFPVPLHNFGIASCICTISKPGPCYQIRLCSVFRKQWLGCGKGLHSCFTQTTSALTLIVFLNHTHAKSDFCNLN